MSHQWMTDKEGYWKAHAIKGESRQSLSLCLIRPYFGWHPAQPDQPRCKRCEGLLAEKSNTSLTEKSNTSQEIIQVLLDACLAVYNSVSVTEPSTIPGPVFAEVMDAIAIAKGYRKE